MYPFLLFIWFMLNGRFTWEITILGILLCGLVHLFAKKYLNYTLKKDLNLLRRIGWFVIYLGVLVWEIVKANWKVMLLILAGDRHTDNRVQEVSEISRGLKLLAKELNGPVICCAQLS